jgi:hypothetical protein
MTGTEHTVQLEVVNVAYKEACNKRENTLKVHTHFHLVNNIMEAKLLQVKREFIS